MCNAGTSCCSHINPHNQVRGHRTGSSHSGAEEYPRKGTYATRAQRDDACSFARSFIEGRLDRAFLSFVRLLYLSPSPLVGICTAVCVFYLRYSSTPE